jgi:hypothetical protein
MLIRDLGIADVDVYVDVGMGDINDENSDMICGH